MVFTITELSMFAPEVYGSSQLSELNFSDLFYDTTYLRDENEGNEKDNRKTVFSQNNNAPFSRRMNPFLSTVIDNHPLNYGSLNKMKTKNNRSFSHSQHPWKLKPSTSFGSNENSNSTTLLKGKETRSNYHNTFNRRNMGQNSNVNYNKSKPYNSPNFQSQQMVKAKTNPQKFGISKTSQQQPNSRNGKPRNREDHNHRYATNKTQIVSNRSKGNSSTTKTDTSLQKYKERGIENKKYADTYSETDTEIYTKSESETNTESELESDMGTGTGTDTATHTETKSESETNTDTESQRKINNEDSKKHFSPVNDKNSKNSKYYYKKSSKGKNNNELSERKHSRRVKNHYFKSLSPKSKKKFRKKKKKLNKSNHGSRAQSYRRKKKKRHKNH